MRPFHFTIAPVLTFILIIPMRGTEKSYETKKDGDGFVPMFNGKDLTGWVNVNCAPGTFLVKDNEIITTGKPTGYLRTDKQYENFIAEFDWKHIRRRVINCNFLRMSYSTSSAAR